MAEPLLLKTVAPIHPFVDLATLMIEQCIYVRTRYSVTLLFTLRALIAASLHAKPSDSSLGVLKLH